MDDLVLREMVFLALGKASMCWSETPKGVFDNERAVQIGEELLQALDAYVTMRQAETKIQMAMNFLASTYLWIRGEK